MHRNLVFSLVEYAAINSDRENEKLLLPASIQGL